MFNWWREYDAGKVDVAMVLEESVVIDGRFKIVLKRRKSIFLDKDCVVRERQGPPC